jgi:hypothetical protein
MLSLTLMVALSQVLCSCGSTQIPVTLTEKTFYTLEGPQGVHVTHFISAQTSDIGVGAWNQISEGMTCMSAADIGSFKQELEDACSEITCNEETVKLLNSLYSRLYPPRSKGK